MTEALRNTDVLDAIGSPVVGLRGTAASAAGGPAGASFAAYWKKNVKGAKPYTGFEGTALDAANVAFLAALKGVLVVAREDQGEPRRRLGPARHQGHLRAAGEGDQAAPRGQGRSTTRARSARSTSTRNGDIGSAVFEIWKYSGAGKIDTLKTDHVQGRDAADATGRAAASRRPPPIPARSGSGEHVAVSGTAATRRAAIAVRADARGARDARSPPPASSAPRRRTCSAHGCCSRRAATGRARCAPTARRSPAIDPANTTYFVSGFIPDGVLVEVELDAIVPEPPR